MFSAVIAAPLLTTIAGSSFAALATAWCTVWVQRRKNRLQLRQRRHAELVSLFGDLSTTLDRTSGDLWRFQFAASGERGYLHPYRHGVVAWEELPADREAFDPPPIVYRADNSEVRRVYARFVQRVCAIDELRLSIAMRLLPEDPLIRHCNQTLDVLYLVEELAAGITARGWRTSYTECEMQRLTIRFDRRRGRLQRRLSIRTSLDRPDATTTEVFTEAVGLPVRLWGFWRLRLADRIWAASHGYLRQV